MPLSGFWTKDQSFKCTDFNCGCELKMILPPQKPPGFQAQHPICLCGSPMRRWPQAAIRTDQYNDV
jgi:hypothetical protein